MNTLNKIRFKKLRLWIAWPYFIILIIFTVTKDQYFREAAPFIILGLALRFWASGYIEKSKTLTTSGPYAFVRNPLYAGNFLLGLGFSLLFHNIYFIIFFLFAFWFFYYFTIREEENELLKKFGEDFRIYKKKVPAFFPRLKPYMGRDKKRFNFKISVKNGELIRTFVVFILIALIYFREEFLLEKEKISLRHAIYFLITIILIIGVLINIGIRRKIDKLEKIKKN